MNISEFAERVVFGNTLEDKLASAADVRDFSVVRSPSVDRLPSPGRPVGMSMHDGPGVSRPPDDRELENEQARGRLLHFLANHELLATELMALVLLKFPEAPVAFRRGVLVTLQEEQEHTRMYLDRMRECGVEFGSYPLSGHFWRVVEPMAGPMDFVSRLSLTFEQANLDYSLHFASVFRRIGDDSTAEVLQQIYQDEIGHVRHGLEWFRQWKDPAASDWDAYREQLEFPMSPQRARGPRCAFNRDGRKQAGLSEEFIDSVEVYRQSRGRPPEVFWFDPAAESSLARQLSAKERQLTDQLGVDLECLMIWLARQDDVVMVRRMPSRAFRKTLLDAGMELPEFVSLSDVDTLQGRPLHALAPWAWTPAAHEFSADLIATTRQSPAPWHDSHAELFRKSWAATRLRGGLEQDAANGDAIDWLCPVETAGCLVGNAEEAAEAFVRIATAGYESALCKQDLATAGRGQRRLSRPGVSDSDSRWLESALSAGPVIVEPELDRVVDLSFLWKWRNAESAPEFLGWTRPIVTAGRRYAGTVLRRPFENCDNDVKRFLLADDCGKLHATQRWLERHLVPRLQEQRFVGHFGVDAFVYRAPGGGLKLKPVVELNPRTTMGHIALEVRSRLAPVVRAEFRILTRAEWLSVGDSLSALQLKKNREGRWESGAVTFSEPSGDSRLFPVILVGDEALECVRRDLRACEA